MDSNVLKERSVLSNADDPDVENAMEATRSKLKPRSSLLKCFDPLYSSPLKNVLELKKHKQEENCENELPVKDGPLLNITVHEETENAVPVVASTPIVRDVSLPEVEEQRENPILTNNIQKGNVEDVVTHKDLLDKTIEIVAISEGRSKTESTQADDVTDKQQESHAVLDGTVLIVNSEVHINQTMPIDTRESQIERQESNMSGTILNIQSANGAMDKEEEHKVLDGTVLIAESKPDNSNQTVLLNTSNTQIIGQERNQQDDMTSEVESTNQSPEPQIEGQELDQNEDTTVKEDQLKNLDETIYYSPIKNVMEVKRTPRMNDTIVASTEQAVIQESAIPPVVEKIETKDASTQCAEIKEEPQVIVKYRDNVNIQEFQKMMKQYEWQFDSHKSEIAKLRQNLATLEMAFSDCHQKYERSKTVLQGYRRNEEILKSRLGEAEERIIGFNVIKKGLENKFQETVNSCNTMLITERNRYETEITKMLATIKMLDIKKNSAEKTLAQKNKECEDLVLLLNDVTVKK